MSKALLVIVALLVSIGVIAPKPASAYLGGCSVGWYSTNDGWSKCANGPWPGGENKQRVKLVCWNSSGGSEIKYGAKVSVGIISAAWCDSSHPEAGVPTYQLF